MTVAYPIPEKACSPLKLPYPQGEDIALNLEVTDMIRSKAVNPKPAMQALKLRVSSKNQRVQMYGLSLVDTCIKNGGDHFLAEIASKEFTDEMSAIIKAPATNPEVRNMALNLLQQWALAFKNKAALSYLPEVYNDLKNSGIKFPPPPVNAPTDHLLETATAPAWVDADACMRCRTAFTFTNRKHHCRNCGLVFCGECSSRTMPLPRYGIKEPVRVCESCWVKAGKNQPAPAVPGRTPRSRRDFDEDLQRAIELSLAQSQPGQQQPSEPPIALRNDMSEDEQMRLAIEASLRDMEQAPSAPAGEEPEFKPLPTFDLDPRETDTLLTFTNTMEQMTAYGERDLSRFPHAHVLHGQAMAVAPKLQRNYEEKSTKKREYSYVSCDVTNDYRDAVGDAGQAFGGCDPLRTDPRRATGVRGPAATAPVLPAILPTTAAVCSSSAVRERLPAICAAAAAVRPAVRGSCLSCLLKLAHVPFSAGSAAVLLPAVRPAAVGPAVSPSLA